MYHIITEGCPKGWGYVADYMGNRIFYGSVKDCFKCIDDLMHDRQCVLEED